MANRMFAHLIFFVLGGLCWKKPPTTTDHVEASAIRTYFYAGGEYIDDGMGEYIFHKQMYVERLSPTHGVKHETPIVFIHGQAQTATNWLNTPDGRKGWASWFLEQGYLVYLVDQPQRGRSAYMPGDGTLATYSAEYISRLFTGVQSYNLWPQARSHTQWPGTGLKGDPIYDTFYASNVQFQNSMITIQKASQQAGAALLDRIGPAILITHSQGGLLGFVIADARPELVKALISLEPTGPPFENRVTTNSTAVVRPYGIANVPIAYDPPVKNAETDLKTVRASSTDANLSDCVRQADPARKLVNQRKMPHLVVTSEASFHAVYDYCTVAYLRQAEVQVDFFDLPRLGIHGNAHFLFLEKNNLKIATRIEKWIKEKVHQ